MRRILTPLLLLFTPLIVFAVEVSPPVPVNAGKIDRTRITGRITRYDDGSFTYIDIQNRSVVVRWSELDPANVYSVHEHLWGKGNPDQWMKLGRQLLGERNGKVPAEKAFARAERLDPSLKEKLDAIRRGEDPDAATTKPATQSATSAPAAPERAWPKATDAEQAAAVAEGRRFVDDARRKLAIDLAVYETKYFLFASDLQPAEANRWAAILDRMYARLAEMFAVPKSENIWRGKALVFVFSQRDTYAKFEKEFYQLDLEDSAGRCHARSDGDVKIAFYRAADDQRFAHVLVHESTHGFLHRYRSPVHVPAWANEGLAEYVAYDLVPHPGLKEASTADARADLQAHKNLADLFDGEQVAAERYPVARALTEFLINTDKKKYVSFINGIKDGLDAQESLKQGFGVDFKKLSDAYGRSMGVSGLVVEHP